MPAAHQRSLPLVGHNILNIDVSPGIATADSLVADLLVAGIYLCSPPSPLLCTDTHQCMTRPECSYSDPMYARDFPSRIHVPAFPQRTRLTAPSAAGVVSVALIASYLPPLSPLTTPRLLLLSLQACVVATTECSPAPRSVLDTFTFYHVLVLATSILVPPDGFLASSTCSWSLPVTASMFLTAKSLKRLSLFTSTIHHIL